MHPARVATREITYMLAFSSILICLSLLGLAVLGLHTFQLKAASVSAERSAPLSASVDDFDFQLKNVHEDNPLAENLSLAHMSGHAPEVVKTISVAFVPQETKTAVPATKQEALVTDRYPLLGAYNQRCVELRQQLKALNQNKRTQEQTLISLYQCAAEAELLHSKTSGNKLSLSQLKTIPPELIDRLSMPYKEIGYHHLRLIKKGDIKRMLAAWGKPNGHQCPRQFHHQAWLQLCHRYG